MTLGDVFDFIRGRPLSVVATADPSGAPEAALVGFAMPPTGASSSIRSPDRKAINLATRPARPKVTLVVGWDDTVSAQIEGGADVAAGAELAAVKEAYFAVWPDGRACETWPDIAYKPERSLVTARIF